MNNKVYCQIFNKDYVSSLAIKDDFVDCPKNVILGDLKELYDKESKGELQTRMVNGYTDGLYVNECLVSLGDKVVMPEVKDLYVYLAENHPEEEETPSNYVEDYIQIFTRELSETEDHIISYGYESNTVRYKYDLGKCTVNGKVDEGLTNVYSKLLTACRSISPVPINAIIINTRRKMKEHTDFMNLGSEVYVGWCQAGMNTTDYTLSNLDSITDKDSPLYTCMCILV